jgi:hypothetical protein
MKWFKVDADTPYDPKIQALQQDLGTEGVGALFLLWCHVANHGRRKPGWSLMANGQPMPEAELRTCTTLNEAKWRRFIENLLQSGHILSSPWVNRRVLAFPAMSRRADTYTQRVVRTMFEQSSNKVRQSSLEEKRSEEKRREEIRPSNGRRRNHICPHTPTCATWTACTSRIVDDGRKKKASPSTAAEES